MDWNTYTTRPISLGCHCYGKKPVRGTNQSCDKFKTLCSSWEPKWLLKFFTSRAPASFHFPTDCVFVFTYFVLPTTCLQAPSDTQPQYGSLEAIQDLEDNTPHTISPLLYCTLEHCFSLLVGVKNVWQLNDNFMCKHQTYFLHFPCLSQRDNGTLTTQEVKATHKAWLLLSICIPMMRLSSTPSILHLDEKERKEKLIILSFFKLFCWLGTMSSKKKSWHREKSQNKI